MIAHMKAEKIELFPERIDKSGTGSPREFTPDVVCHCYGSAAAKWKSSVTPTTS